MEDICVCKVCGKTISRKNFSQHLSLHKEFNSLERSQKQTLFKPKRYYENLDEIDNKKL